VFRVVFKLSVLLTFVASALVLVVSWFYFHSSPSRSDLFAPAALMVGAYIVIDNISWNFDSVLSAHRAFEVQFVARMTTTVSLLVLTPLFALIGRSVWEIAAASIAANALGLIVRVVKIPEYVGFRAGDADVAFGRSKLRGIVMFGLRAMPSSVSLIVASQSTVWILGVVASANALGAFSRAMNLAGRMNDVPFKVAGVYYPTQVRNAHNGDLDAMVRAMGDTLRMSFVPLMALAAAAAGASFGVLRVFGNDFASADTALVVLLLSALVFFMDVIVGLTLTALGRPGVVSKGSVLGMTMTLALVWPLADGYGATGAAAAIATGQVASLLVKFVAVLDRLEHHLVFRSVVRPGTSVLAATLVAYTVAHVIDTQMVSIIGTGIAGLSGIVAFFVVITLFGSPDVPLIRKVLERIRRQPVGV
ncbi:MAG: polysaccharide biosynthesis C-terminal domain-containing protein, partial [Acidimicrobiia bacterium]